MAKMEGLQDDDNNEDFEAPLQKTIIEYIKAAESYRKESKKIIRIFKKFTKVLKESSEKLSEKLKESHEQSAIIIEMEGITNGQ